MRRRREEDDHGKPDRDRDQQNLLIRPTESTQRSRTAGLSEPPCSLNRSLARAYQSAGMHPRAAHLHARTPAGLRLSTAYCASALEAISAAQRVVAVTCHPSGPGAQETTKRSEQ